MQQLTARVVRNQPSSSAYHTMMLTAPAIAEQAKPGQFVMVSAGPQTFLKRPMGLSAADPAVGTIEFLYQVVGTGTRNLTGFTTGESVSVLGPLGTSFVLAPATKHATLIGGGTGTGPMLYLSRWLREHHPDVVATLMLGARTGMMHVDTKPIEQLGVDVLMATNDGSLGTRGTVVDILTSRFSPPASDQLFACGPDPMLEAVATLATEHQIPCQVSVEARMACGFGACLGCICQTSDGSRKLVCVDGPVFDANVVFASRRKA